MGSDESHFNVSIGSEGQSHKTVSTDHNLFEQKGEPKRYRTKVLPLTSLTALPLGQTGSHVTAKRGHELLDAAKVDAWCRGQRCDPPENDRSTDNCGTAMRPLRKRTVYANLFR